MTTCNHQTNVKTFFVLLCLSIVLFVAALGCSKDKQDNKAVSKGVKDTSPVVVRIGDDTITALELKNYLSSRPMSRHHRASEDYAEKRLDEMVLEVVLYQEALRLKLDQDPEVRRRIRQMLTRKLLEEQVEKEVWIRQIEEKEYQDYYDQHKDEFSRPEQVRLADIFIAVPPDATADQKAALRKKAETALAEALKVREKRSGFGGLVRKYSDTHGKYRKGDTGFFDTEGKPVGIDKKLAEAAFKLERVGSMSEHVIETPEGYHVIMLVGKRPAFHRELEAVKREIDHRIRREALKKAREAYIENLKKKANIKVDRASVAEILKELEEGREKQTPPAPPKRPPRPGNMSTPPPFPGHYEEPGRQ